jgi:hypothetical protein
MKKERWGLVLLLCVLLSLFMGCITEKKVNHYLQDNKPYMDSVTAAVLNSHPCFNTPILQGNVDTTGLINYLLGSGLICPEEKLIETNYTPTVISPNPQILKSSIVYIKQDIRRIIDSLKEHLGKDTIIDRRTVDALTLKLTNANNNINKLNLSIANEKLATKVMVDNSNGWMWKAIITWILLLLAFFIWFYLQIKPKI